MVKLLISVLYGIMIMKVMNGIFHYEVNDKFDLSEIAKSFGEAVIRKQQDLKLKENCNLF